ncbi:MAG: winged helix-turn-helix domain-containing protein [Anaerolineae bacterium]
MSGADLSRGHASLLRQSDLQALFAALRDMHCVSVVGVSNSGKSALLHAAADPAVRARFLGNDAAGFLPIYIDFNRMLDMTEQAFYELILRCTLDVLNGCAAGPACEAMQRVQAAYEVLIKPDSSFQIPLSFAQAMAAIGDLLPEKVVFLFDEFDGPVGGIDGRVFLNLRALKDDHRQGLTYVTATNRRLEELGRDHNVAEFAELFARHVLYISWLDDAEIAQFAADFAAREDVTFSEQDLAFIRYWAGGHPGLLDGVCHLLGALTGRPVRDPTQDWIIHRRATELIPLDPNIQIECRHIWADLTVQEQEALIWLARGATEKEPDGLDAVTALRLVVGQGPERRIFAHAFADFVQRQQVARRPGPRPGLLVDAESGEVWVNGVQAPMLTNLEHRLLLLLYGRLGKIVTKYEVVEAVWGEDYIDEVDDARIEKLISRLRQKIEPDAANPRYLLTVRGRGYKLVNA